MSSSSISGFLVFWSLLHLFAFSTFAAGTEVSIPALETEPGKVLRVPVMVNKVDNLAGVKLVMTYDSKLLTYKAGNKTRHTDSLMHIINDKNPGRLIAVMAGARGIQGTDFPLLTLTFLVSDAVKKERSTTIRIGHVEMMSDKLEPISCTVRSEPIRIRAPEFPER